MKGSSYKARDGQAGVGKRLGHDGAIDFAGAQHLQQFDREVFLQHQAAFAAYLSMLWRTSSGSK
jgi:hypothetical protein